MKNYKDNLFKLLSNEEDARACKPLDDSACKVVPHNFILTLFSQLFSQFADALLNPKVTLPWLLQSLQVPAVFISWLVPIRESGSLLPQLAIASFIRKLPLRKWVWVFGSLTQALCMLALIAISFTLSSYEAGIAIIGTLIIFSLARGFNSIAAKDVLGKTIPKTQRGNLSGLTASLSGLATVLFGLFFIFSDSRQDQTILWALGLAAVMWLLAALSYGQINEYKGATDGGKNGLKAALSKFRMIYEDSNFALFLLTRTLLLCSALSAPFYIVLASEQAFDFAVLAIFMLVSGAASLVSAPIWGRLSDLSSKRVMALSSALVAINAIVLYVAHIFLPQIFSSIWFLPLLYFILSVAHQGVRLGRKTYLVNLAEGNNRTDYVAVGNTFTGIVLLILGSAGLLAEQLGALSLILMFSSLSLLAIISSYFLKD